MENLRDLEDVDLLGMMSSNDLEDGGLSLLVWYVQATCVIVSFNKLLKLIHFDRLLN